MSWEYRERIANNEWKTIKKSAYFFTFVESNNTEQHGKSNNHKREKRYRETLSL